MAAPKTVPTNQPVEEFIDRIDNENQRKDSRRLVEIMQRITGDQPKMWGDSIIGFGSYHYVYKSGREGDWLLTGFSPRKKNMTVYVMNGFKKYDEKLKKLGKCSNSVSCLYFKRLDDLEIGILEEILNHSVQYLRTKYG